MALRFHFAVLAIVAAGSTVQAETGDVPMLADGRVDVMAVWSSFTVRSPILDEGTSREFSGEILGRHFTGTYDAEPSINPFGLTIRSSELSEHASYLAAVMLNLLFCKEAELSPTELKWRETSVPVADGWRVEMSCQESQQ